MGFRILAVDDNPVVAEMIALTLDQAGYEVETAPSAAEGLVALQRDPPDLLLLDLQMPGVDGLEMLRIMQARKVGAGAPVIVLTGEDDPHFISRARELGAAGYLLKPFKAGPLVAKVKRVLGNADTVWLDDYHTVTRAAQDDPAWAAPRTRSA